VKQAGLWVRERSAEGEVIVTTSWPQVRYYAERPTAGLPGTPEKLETLLRARRAPFLVLSDYERRPAWVEPYLAENAARLRLVFVSGDVRGLETRVYDCSRLADEVRSRELGRFGASGDVRRRRTLGVGSGPT
jgi:hypothetical protein